MYDITTLKILEAAYTEPGIHKRALSKKIGLTMPSIDNALLKLKEILIEERSGNRLGYRINYLSDNAVPAIYAVEYSRFSRLPSKIRNSVGDYLSELKDKPLLFIIFGSYAKGDYTRSSDLDVLLVFQALGNQKEIESIARKVSMGTNVSFNPVYLDYGDFARSFHDKTNRFFMNLRQDKIILSGVEWWRLLINEEA